MEWSVEMLLGNGEGARHGHKLAECIIFGGEEPASSLMDALRVSPQGLICQEQHGLNSYIAEVPTCLGCLRRLDYMALQVRVAFLNAERIAVLHLT